jgi:hypothetical protein
MSDLLGPWWMGPLSPQYVAYWGYGWWKWPPDVAGTQIYWVNSCWQPIRSVPYRSKVTSNLSTQPAMQNSSLLRWQLVRLSRNLSHWELCSPGPATGPTLRQTRSLRFATMMVFMTRILQTPTEAPNLEDHLLSAIRDWLFICINVTSIPEGFLLHPQFENAPWRGEKGTT